jgi:hypothetical protein
MCGSLMALIGRGGVTSSVSNLIWILWYGNLFDFEKNYFTLFTDLYVNMCFSRAIFFEWIDMWKALVSQMKILTTESKRLYLEQIEEIRERRARQLEGKELDIYSK